jgi:cytochrome P450
MLAALQFVSEEVFHLLPSLLLIPTPRNLRFRRARAELDRVVLGIIEQRRRHGGGDDLLAMLMEARDAETGEGMSDRQLRDEIMTFVLAGHETTAVTLAWACLLLAQHADVADALRREVSSVLNGRVPALTDLPGLALTRRVIDETLRLYPPVAGISRETYAPDEIAGYSVPAKSGVMMSAYVTHRHPAFWREPERFDPDRFTPENSATRPRFAYFPFGGGPRLCIGNEFALMEGQILLAMIAQRYRVEVASDHTVQHEIRITLRPQQPMRMVVKPL